MRQPPLPSRSWMWTPWASGAALLFIALAASSCGQNGHDGTAAPATARPARANAPVDSPTAEAQAILRQAREVAAAHEPLANALAPGGSILTATPEGIVPRAAATPTQWRGASLFARLSTRANEPFSVGPSDDPAERVTVHLGGAAPSQARVTDGVAVYPEAHRSTDAIVVAETDRLEVLYLLKDATAPTTWRWAIQRPETLLPRQEGKDVVFAAPKGATRLAVRARAGAVDAAGRRHAVTVRLDGDALYIALAPEAGVEVAYPMLVDPEWVIMVSGGNNLFAVWGESPTNVFAGG